MSTLDYKKINAAHMLGVMQLLKVPGTDPEATPQENADRLQTWFTLNVPADKIASCDTCKGDSDPNLDVCPFCGVGDDTTEAKVPEAKAPTTPPAPPTPKPKKEPKEAPPMTTQSIPTRSEKAAALAKAPTNGKALATEAQLNAEVTKVAELQAKLAGAFGDVRGAAHDLGAHINEKLFKNHLWKQRTETVGEGDKAKAKTKYTSFDQFVRSELGMTSANAYSLMDVAKEFTRDEVARWGTTKLALLMKAPDPETKADLKKDLDKKSTRQVAADVKKARDAKGVERRETGRKVTPSGEKHTSRPARANTKSSAITVASIEGRRTINLFAKPASKTDEPARAAKLKDIPWGKEDLASGVVRYYSVQERAGGLVLVIDTRREDPTAE